MSNSRVSTWSGIRNKLENDYLCPALRGHIQYFAASYSKSADHEGRAAIRVDGAEVLRSNLRRERHENGHLLRRLQHLWL